MTKSYSPNKNDIVSAYRSLVHPGTAVKIDLIFKQVRKAAKHAGITLKKGWAKQCEEKLPGWFN